MNFLKNATFIKNSIISLTLILSSSAAFGLGRLSILMGEKEPISIENYSPVEATSSLETGEPAPVHLAPALPVSPPKSSPPSVSVATPGAFVASKTGKSYYFPWCGIVKRIKLENQVTFNSRAAAEAAGYKPGNCVGLK